MPALGSSRFAASPFPERPCGECPRPESNQCTRFRKVRASPTEAPATTLILAAFVLVRASDCASPRGSRESGHSSHGLARRKRMRSRRALPAPECPKEDLIAMRKRGECETKALSLPGLSGSPRTS
jgi:hypothetical protein